MILLQLPYLPNSDYAAVFGRFFICQETEPGSGEGECVSTKTCPRFPMRAMPAFLCDECRITQIGTLANPLFMRVKKIHDRKWPIHDTFVLRPFFCVTLLLRYEMR